MRASFRNFEENKIMKISVYLALSANGFISSPKGIPDWLSQEYATGFMEICQHTKAVIMGRKTYQIIAPDYLPLREEGTTVVLTTSTNTKPANPTVIFACQTPGKIVSMLEAKGHREAVIIGGMTTVSEFMNTELVDDIYFVIEPVLFGAGLPMIKNTSDFKLSLRSAKKLNANTLRLHYQVEKQNHHP